MDDDCSLHEVRAVLNHLDSLKAVHNVYFTERPPATAADALHLGLPRWQYAYTEVGLDPIARQWARLVAPERLALVPGTNGAVLELRHAPALPPTRVK